MGIWHEPGASLAPAGVCHPLLPPVPVSADGTASAVLRAALALPLPPPGVAALVPPHVSHVSHAPHVDRPTIACAAGRGPAGVGTRPEPTIAATG
jgi:hypothetical protein